jgi:glycosyltransferase involved in cell wall biosynthesis
LSAAAHEGFCLSVLEAAAAGLASIAPARPPFTEYLDGTTARLVDVDAIDDIAAALVELIADASLRRRLARAARTRAAAWTWQRSAAMHVNHYERVIRNFMQERSRHA